MYGNPLPTAKLNPLTILQRQFGAQPPNLIPANTVSELFFLHHVTDGNMQYNIVSNYYSSETVTILGPIDSYLLHVLLRMKGCI